MKQNAATLPGNGQLKRKRFRLKILLMAGGIFILVAIIGYWVANEPRPSGVAGDAAEALAREMQEAINLEAWENTGAVMWTFAGRHDHLWDRNRHLARVRWKDVEALLDLNTGKGVIYRDGTPVGDSDAVPLVRKALEYWYNDAFWLNPIAKLFDPGVKRALVNLTEPQRGLLVTYTSGGVTPGDAYLWIVDQNGLPSAWKMWVSILPIGGIRTTWEDWTRLSTGALVSTRHSNGPFDVVISDIRAADSLAGLPGEADAFAPLIEEP